MPEHKDRESFIPYRRADVVELCVEDGKLNAEQTKNFREFCEVVSAYYHFDFHSKIESLKNNFAHLNPDADTKPKLIPTAQECKQREQKLFEDFEEVMLRANYTRLTQEEWEQATQQESLIKLRMTVDFNDFEVWRCYHRGDGQTTVQLKKLFSKQDFTMDTFERVVLAMKFKDEAYFTGKGIKVDKLNFTPGKMYIYMYKKIPKADLEILFPNVQISMNWKDRLMLIVPAIGAGAATLIKVLPALLIIFGIVWAWVQKKEIPIDDPKNIIAALTGLAVLGGFAVKQYIGYQNKRLKFLKDVTDTLFFRNLDCNGGVFNSIIDSAEEEEGKEVILAYYHLLTNDGPGLNQEALDSKIEEWLEKKFNTKVDFAVEKALKKLENLKGKLEESGNEVAIVSRGSDGICKPLQIDQAKTVIDYIWDNIFQYNE